MSDHEVASIAWTILVGCFVFSVALAIRSDRNLLSPGVIITTLLGLYTLVLPGRYVLFGTLLENAFRLDVFLEYCFMCLLSLVGFTMAYHFSQSTPNGAYRPLPALSPARLRVGATIALMIGTLLIALLVQQLGGLNRYLQFGYGSDIYLALQGKGELAYGFHLVAFGTMALAFADYVKGYSWPWTSLIVALPLILLYLTMGDRASMIRLGLAYVLLHYLARNRRPGVVFILALVIGAALLVVLGHARGQPGIEPKAEFALRNFQWEWLNIFTVVGELQTPAFALWRLLETPDLSFKFGLSYLNAVPYLVPQQLYPGRPDALANDYLKLYYPTLYANGSGLGLLAIAEAYWNFGVLGPFVVFGIIGWFFRRVYDWLMDGLPNRVLMYAALMSGAAIFVRIDFGLALKATLYYVVPALLVIGLGCRPVDRAGRIGSERPAQYAGTEGMMRR